MSLVVEQIRKALANAPQSMAEIAKATGLHRVNVSQFRAGTRELPLRSLEILADYLGLAIVAVPKGKQNKSGK
jgi:transcriptional regulator with XRE-family HTH domain